MNKKIVIIILILFIALAFCGYAYIIITGQNQPSLENTSNEKPKKIEELNIAVYSPKKDSDVFFPFDIRGEARVFENTVNIRIIDKNTSDILYEGFVTANAPDMGQFGEFNKTIDYLYKKPSGEDLILEVYWASPKDGSELDKVSIPVKIKIGDISTLKIFFNNNNLDPQISCNKVFPVERIIPKTTALGEKSINLLLEGVSRLEQESGYSTNINFGTKLQKLTIEKGTANADFDEQLESGVGGSCKVSAIRAQITETLKQFSTVKNVIISINGRIEDILQP